MPVSREQTSHETREDAEKVKIWRPAGRLEVPDPPAGYKYRWVRHSTRGTDDVKNVLERSRQHYEPVPASEVGQESDEVVNSRFEGAAQVGDVMLMKVPIEVAEQRRRYYEQRSRLMEEAVKEKLQKSNNEVMPIHDLSETTRVSHGSKGPATFPE